VIVRGDRIIAAGCLLPLPEEGSVRQLLGTRPRAALWLSLASDALVLVVSDEAGTVLVIAEGTMSHNLDPASLRRSVALKVRSDHSSQVTFSNPSAKVDASHATPGAAVKLNVIAASTVNGISVQTPAPIVVAIDTLTSKEVPVEVKASAGPGWSITSTVAMCP